MEDLKNALEENRKEFKKLLDYFYIAFKNDDFAYCKSILEAIPALIEDRKKLNNLANRQRK